MNRIAVGVLALLAACATPDQVVDTPTPTDDIGDVELELVPIGPEKTEVDAFEATLPTRPEIVAFTGEGHRVRVLFLKLDNGVNDEGIGAPTSNYTAVMFDYTTNTEFEVHGDFKAAEPVASIAPSDIHPSPSLEEVDEAVQLLLDSDPALAARVDAGELQIFRAMPPLLISDNGDRMFPLGIRENVDADMVDREIVGVNLSGGTIIHYDGGAPPTASITAFSCNPPPSAGQSGSGNGNQGWARLVARLRGTEIWSMTVTRPSDSSGSDGSGVDLTDVRYRGKTLLAHAHVPILNVLYVNNACGPYRDWQWQENPFEIAPNSTNVANQGSGIVVTDWAKTMRELRDDSGNFYGVAAYLDRVNNQIVLISELAAGWYRYATEWRFALNGELIGRFGFDAVDNGCTCRRHTHHAYWRMDFDLGSGNNRFEIHDDSTGWTQVTTEGATNRNEAEHRYFRVSDTSSGDSYLIYPGRNEDLPDSYASNTDGWFLRDHSNEVEDRGVYTGTGANLNAFVNGESVVDTDNVFWWSGHFLHDDSDPLTNQTHTVQIRLVPENW